MRSTRHVTYVLLRVSDLSCCAQVFVFELGEKFFSAYSSPSLNQTHVTYVLFARSSTDMSLTILPSNLCSSCL